MNGEPWIKVSKPNPKKCPGNHRWWVLYFQFALLTNVPLKIIRHLEPVKGIFVSRKHTNVILYPRWCVDHWKLRLYMVLRSFEVFFIFLLLNNVSFAYNDFSGPMIKRTLFLSYIWLASFLFIKPKINHWPPPSQPLWWPALLNICFYECCDNCCANMFWISRPLLMIIKMTPVLKTSSRDLFLYLYRWELANLPYREILQITPREQIGFSICSEICNFAAFREIAIKMNSTGRLEACKGKINLDLKVLSSRENILKKRF